MKKTILFILAAALLAATATAQTKKEEQKPAPKPGASASTAKPGESAPAIPPATSTGKTETKGSKAPAKIEIRTDAEKLSYSLGVDIGTRLKDLGTEVDLGIFLRGVDDRLKDRDPVISPEEMNSVKMAFFDKKKAEAESQKKALAEKNRRDGETFLAENRHKPGIKMTNSGLQYEVVQEGTGEFPKPADKVKVHYRGTLLDGTEFDSSHKRGQPAVFPVSGVIRGWTEGLQLMKTGSKFKFFIPSDLAYGERGAGKDIGPNATLVFEVELLGIEPIQSPAAAPPGAPPAQPPQAPSQPTK